ncbi:hypothetical protein M8C21_022031 [Ambrosia artemisiifolia]|uniref:tRNA (guanine(26)-N(2))-dimethyltransferase n=1 Tax=Ambrosia artemisiifolia TaxID=4212 RepID=A0AAD5GK96_AMBAR|nr:hypothetical protein M8C21_022031 [Ambrosia artemisiifolia]
MGSVEEINKTGKEEEINKKPPPFDLNDYTIIKEGEAEILMHKKNEVFYNKAQVNNRDMSIAVLRTFISKRKEEHEAFLSKRMNKALKKENHASNGNSNGECEPSKEIPEGEPCSNGNEPEKPIEGKGQGQLKPPRVLEALSASGLRALRYAREVEEIEQVVALDNDKASVEACRRNIKFNGAVASAKVESNLADARVYMLTHPKEFDVVDLDPYGSPSVFLDSAVQSIADGGLLMCTATDMAVLCGSNGENTSVRYLPGFGPVVPQECSDCGKKYNMGGPIWSDPIHDQDWVASMLTDVKAMKHRYPAFNRINAVLTTISEELPDVPLFLSLHNLGGTLKCTSPSAVIFRSAVINAGYRISGTHVKNHPVKEQSPDQSGSVILAKEPVLQANFARAVASLSKAQAKKVARFLPNPERHWGPKLRAGRTITSKHVSLLGAEAVNEVLNGHDQEAEEPQVKRQKTEDTPSIP